MSVAVALQNYSFAYPGGAPVLKDCSFSLQYGELVVLSGLSGRGKTTLLSAVSGVIPHCVRGEAQGEILVDGRPTGEMGMSDIARKVGYVIQNPDNQIFHSRVADEIAFGCENLNLPPAEIGRRIGEVCTMLELDREAETRTLSGGQKQRLMMACVLAMGQKILLLDEPLANLDIAGAYLLLKVLKKLCAKGYAVLLAEHRLDMMLPFADRVFRLENGALQKAEKARLHDKSLRQITHVSAPRPFLGKHLCAEQVAFSAGKKEILHTMNLDIQRGTRTVILGENGCGKTTFLRILAGLIKPTGGRVDADIPAKPGSRRWFRSVGYVYQEPSYQLFAPTVNEELMGGARNGWGQRCLRAFDLEELAQRHPHSLSEGQKRRVSIAAVCAGAPEILLLDEPTVGQDDGNLELLIHALNEMHEETGNTIVTITHDRRCAAALADRVIWVAHGRVARLGGKELIDAYFARAF